MNLDWSVVWRNAWALAEGTELTVALAVLTMAISVPGGVLLAVMRLSRSRPLSAASACFVELFRNLPLILVIYTAYYVMPIALGIAFSPFVTGLVALSLNVSAYNGETFRAGIGSIRKGQSEAAFALGMTRWQAMQQVVLPQAAPWIFTAARSCWSLTWRIMVFVEVIGRPDGVGYRIQYWFQLADMPRAIASAVPLIVVVVLVDVAVLRTIERRIARWRPAELR